VLRVESAALGDRFAEPCAPAEVCDLLARSLLVHTHGVGVPSALVPAILLAQDRAARNKRLGHLATCCLLSPDDAGLLPLMQNTLRKDLCSHDSETIAVALLTFSRVADADLCAALAPDIEALLDRPLGSPPTLRAKAITALSRCWQSAAAAEGAEGSEGSVPAVESTTQRRERLRALLGERHPAVLSAAAAALRALPQFESAARELLPELNSAQVSWPEGSGPRAAHPRPILAVASVQRHPLV
jgi:hypothetical protein